MNECTYSWGPATGQLAWPTDDPEIAHDYAKVMSSEGATWTVHQYPPGDPQPGKLIATYRNGELAAEGAAP